MSNVIILKPRPKHVSTVRSRDGALSVLLPKFLGALWECGEAYALRSTHMMVTARIQDDLDIGLGIMQPGAFVIHAYTRAAGDSSQKVFSAHLVDRAQQVRTRHARYWGGRCILLSWRRGGWEDRIVTHKAMPRSFAHLMTAGPTARR